MFISKRIMKVVKCDLCLYTTTSVYTFKLHKLSVHSDLRPWQCTHPGCNYKGALTKRNLKLHLQSHESRLELRKPYICTFEDCDYRTGYKSAMKDHVNRWHSMTVRTRDVPCHLCPAKFFRKSDSQWQFPEAARSKCARNTLDTHMFAT